jgi:transposase
MIVDSLGLLLKVVVSEGNAGERVLAAYALMELMEERPEFLEKVEVMWVDSGYALYALEPAHEATFHARSYGFRSGRAAHDAQKFLFLTYAPAVMELIIGKPKTF